jgi:hypothetical protein
LTWNIFHIISDQPLLFLIHFLLFSAEIVFYDQFPVNFQLPFDQFQLNVNILINYRPFWTIFKCFRQFFDHF